jgi:predicted ArsR family transcriptional regulator
MHATLVLQYLKKHGQLVDWEIASAMDIPLADVRSALIALSERGDVSQCTITRFLDGKPVEGMLCRVAGTIPPKAPGRKPSD